MHGVKEAYVCALVFQAALGLRRMAPGTVFPHGRTRQSGSTRHASVHKRVNKQ